jgi:hypothetical protein
VSVHRLSYVLPVHQDEKTIADYVDKLALRLSGTIDPEIVLVENGSRDASWPACEALAGKRHGVEVLAFRELSAGIGYAYSRGLEELVRRHGASDRRWAVLTGSDLPFAFTDLDNALPEMDKGATRIIAGSKAHPESQAWAGARRKVMSLVYRASRNAILGMTIGDSQGSFFVRLDLAADILPLIETRGFFYTTELVFFAQKAGDRIVEVPVVLEASQLVAGASSTRPIKHGIEMLKQLAALRRRAGAVRR